MHRRKVLGLGLGLLVPAISLAHSAHKRRQRPEMSDSTTEPKRIDPLEKSDQEWRELVEPDAYQVLFEDGTERAFTSGLLEEKRQGTFICAACFLPLFESDTKYESGTGWPSFFRAIDNHIDTKRDFKLIYPRTEYHCARCSGHQGHVFNDGPRPTGQRFCNNGVALRFIASDEELPPLRS